MKRRKPKRQDIDLVHVIWGPDDQGVVSLKQGRWLMYVWGKHLGGHHSVIPTVGIEDADFHLIMEPVKADAELRKDDPDCFEATWDDVPTLLTHVGFPLLERIDQFDNAGFNPADLMLLSTHLHERELQAARQAKQEEGTDATGNLAYDVFAQQENVGL